MLITFKSKAAAEIIMYQSHIAPVLEGLGKSADRGVITAAECGAAIHIIEKLIARERQQKTSEVAEVDEYDLDDFEKRARSQTVSAATRFFPFMEMLRAAQKKQTDILWGV